MAAAGLSDNDPDAQQVLSVLDVGVFAAAGEKGASRIIKMAIATTLFATTQDMSEP
ncbi:MAG TPA: hypothetical protein VN047_10645 [Sphingopyxis sp.]|uniref:hypothetical protein n=1 Tax=Sphingopyxis sp. TaxID=1908224 RepID=UPI002BD68843|nr:hypothetical protein [Sphingopyxis sp.]HWW57337.1 hypothetical protein [Sphingopyxis sp.]